MSILDQVLDQARQSEQETGYLKEFCKLLFEKLGPEKQHEFEVSELVRLLLGSDLDLIDRLFDRAKVEAEATVADAVARELFRLAPSGAGEVYRQMKGQASPLARSDPPNHIQEN